MIFRLSHGSLLGAAFLVSCILAAPTGAIGCGSNGDDSDTSDDGGAGDGAVGDGAVQCSTSAQCDGGSCIDGVCCDSAHACGASCCGGTDVCSFAKCVTPGATCYDSSDCAPNEYCEFSLGDDDAGAPSPVADASCVSTSQKSGRCLPLPPICAPDAGTSSGGTATCLEQCEYHPTAPFDPALKYTWGGPSTPATASDVMMTPIVVELDDDNCDGKVDQRDIPEIVFTTFASGAYTSSGTLHAISVVSGAVVDKWSVPAGATASTQIAGGDIDGLPGNEVVVCNGGNVVAYHGDGTPYWTTTAPVSCFMPAIADLDHDGKPEVIVEGAILNGATGAVLHALTGISNGFAVADIDGDGQLDIVGGASASHADGTTFATTGLGGVWPAVGDFDHDGLPEVVSVVHGSHHVYVWHYDAASPTKATVVRTSIDINGSLDPALCPSDSAGFTAGGGPATIGDFNGDNVPDVALAGGVGYAVLDGSKLLNAAIPSTDPSLFLFLKQTHDCSSAATGSSLFDFNGDGNVEVAYADEFHLHIYDGKTGVEEYTICNTNGTLEENPVVADVDGDGQADLVVVSNAYAETCPDADAGAGNDPKESGIRIYESKTGSWVQTRRVWNEHAYHITNVNEDGTIPKNEAKNWTTAGLDNFRQNKQPGDEFAAPDAVVTLAPRCNGTAGLIATVRNIGEAALPAGVVVGFYQGTPGTGALLGHMSTTHILYPAESEDLVLAGASITSPTVYAVVDDGSPPHAWHECRTDNDTTDAVSSTCSGPR